MATFVIRIDMPPKGIEVTGDGSSPTDDEMREEQEARQEFLDRIGPHLASLPDRPPARAGNVNRVELLGEGTWSRLNHYLLLISVDIGEPRLDLESVLPPDCEVSVIGSYSRLQEWPAGG